MFSRMTGFWVTLLAVTLVSGCGKANRYMLAKDKDGIVYRTDRATGETVMFKDGKFKEVRKERPPVIVKFDKDDFATASISGRGRSDGNSNFSGHLYNENSDIEVVSVTLRIVHKDGDEDCPRLYKYVCNKTPRADGTVEGAPQTAWDFSVKIVRGDEPKGCALDWSIAAMEGIRR